MIFEQCKVGRFFAWAGRDPGIKSPVIGCSRNVTQLYMLLRYLTHMKFIRRQIDIIYQFLSLKFYRKTMINDFLIGKNHIHLSRHF